MTAMSRATHALPSVLQESLCLQRVARLVMRRGRTGGLNSGLGHYQAAPRLPSVLADTEPRERRRPHALPSVLIACAQIGGSRLEPFADRLTNLREDRGWSQAELARRINVTRAAVCDWEHGRRFPSLLRLADLADVLGTTMDELWKGSAS